MKDLQKLREEIEKHSNTINEAQKQIELIKQQLDKEFNQDKWPQQGDVIFCHGGKIIVRNNYTTDSPIHSVMLDRGELFRTEEECEMQDKYLKALKKYNDLAIETGEVVTEEDWMNFNIIKYFLHFSYQNRQPKIYIDCLEYTRYISDRLYVTTERAIKYIRENMTEEDIFDLFKMDVPK